MFDFSEVKAAIINDLKPVSIQNYLIFKELNCLPKEINLIIAYNSLQISDELITLNEDIEYSYKYGICDLITQSLSQDIDILSEYEINLKDVPNIKHLVKYKINMLFIYNPKSKCPQNRCVDILYSLDNNIFYKLLFNYIRKNQNFSSHKDYEYHYNRNLDNYLKMMDWKTNIKYIKLLKIVNLDKFLIK